VSLGKKKVVVGGVEEEEEEEEEEEGGLWQVARTMESRWKFEKGVGTVVEKERIDFEIKSVNRERDRERDKRNLSSSS
jgi:hypothetical protein